MAAWCQTNIKSDTFSFIPSATSLKQQQYSLGREHTVIIQDGMAEDMVCLHFNVRTLGPMQLMLNMTQIISHRFLHARLEQSNISKEISGNIGICSFPLPGPEGGNADCVCVCVCACCVYLTSGHEREQEKALRRDGWFSHMGNSIGARGKYLNKQRTVHWAKWCVPTNDITLPVELVSHCGSTWEAVHVEITSPHVKTTKNISHECLWTVNNVHTFHINTHSMGPAVCDLREECVVLRVRLCGISCGAPILSLGSSGGQPPKRLDLALAGDSDIQKQSIFDTRLWLIVRKRWGRFVLGPCLKTWRSSPPPLGTASHKWNPWIMKTLKVSGYILQPAWFFMEVILVVSCRKLMF